MTEEIRGKLQRIARSFLDLQREKEERFKRLHEAPIGDEARRIAFENMHFMEDKQWIQINDVLGELKRVAKEAKECLTNGWTEHERSHWDGFLEEEVEPYWPTLYFLLKILEEDGGP